MCELAVWNAEMCELVRFYNGMMWIVPWGWVCPKWVLDAIHIPKFDTNFDMKY